MANEVAALGLKVDASGVTSGISALDDLAARGPKVENAMDGVEKSVSKTGKSLKTMGIDAAKGLQDISAAAPKVAASFGNIAKSAEDAQKALSGINASLSGLGQVSATANQAATGLSSFTKSLADSQKSLVEMQAQIREASLAAAQMGNVFASSRTSVQASAKTQSDVAKSTTDMGSAYKSAGEQVKAYVKAPEEASAANQRAAKSMDTTAVAAKTLASAMAVVGVSFGAQELINMVDGYGKVTSQLRLATNGASDYAKAMESVRQISRGAQQGISEVGTLYARIANGTAELGLSQKRLSEITEVVALSLKASGATASESSSAMLQLSQAFASGVLRGEEFNSVNEAAPRLMKALADGIGQPVGALRKMAEEGKLTADVLATALPKALEEVRVEAAKMQTIGGSFTVLKNSMMEFFGTTAQASGAVSVITKSVELLADNLNLVTAAALGFGAAKLAQFMITAGAAATKNATDTIAYVAALNQQRAASIAAAEAEAAVSAARVAGLGALQSKLAAERQAALTEAAAATSTSARTQALMAASVAELNLTRTSAQLTAATAAQTAAQTALSGAITATSTAATVASRALALVGGPIGLITTALGLGVTAWMAWGNSADAASAQAKNSIVSVHQDIVSRLDEQIRKLKERAGLLAAGNAAAAKDIGPETEELARLNARIQSMKSQGASLAGADQIVLIELQRQYDNLNASLETRKGLQETINGLGVQDRLNALELKKGGFTKEWMEELKTWTDALKAGMKTPQEYATHVTEMNKRRYESTAAGKEEAKQSKANASAAKSEESSYAKLMATVKAKIAANEEELFAGGKLTESAKLRIQLQAQLDSGSKKLTAAHKEEVKQQIAKLEAQEKEEKAIKRAIALNDARLAQDQEMAEAQASMQAKVDAVRLSIHDYSVAVKDSTEMANLELQTLGMQNVARNTLIEQLRIEQDLRKRIEAIKAAPYATQEARDADIAKVTAEAMKAKANAQTKAYVSEWEKAYDQSSQALTDALMRGGKNAGEYLKDYFRTLVLRPVIQAIVQPLAGGIADVVTSSLGIGSSGGGVSSAIGAFGNISKLSSLFGGGATAGASLTSLGFANAVGAVGGDAIGALAAANGMWAGVATGAQAAAQAAVAANLALEAGTGVALEAGTLAQAASAAETAGGLSGALGSIPGWGWALAGGALLLSQLDFGSRGANHSGAAASSLGIGNTAAAQKLMGDSRGDWYTDLTDRYNADLDKQLSGTVNALAGVYEKLSGYAGDAARSIELVGGFAVNGKYGDEGAVGYGQLWDRVSGQYLGGFSNRDLGTDKDKAWTSFVGQMGGLIVAELKASDIPGWMRKELEAIGDDVTVDGLEKALVAIAAADAAFKGWGDTLTGFANLSAEVQTSLLATSGTLEGLATNVNTFYSGFYSEQERMATLQRQVLAQLGSLGVTVDTSTAEAAKASFKATVEGALNAGNGELAAKLLALSGSFATAADYAAQSAEKIVSAAQESAAAADSLRSSLIALGERLPGAGAEVQQLRVEGLASQVQGLFAGVGIEKDAGVLAGQIMSATSSDIEQYFRDMWGMLNTDEARQKLVDVTGALLDLSGSAEAAAQAVASERLGLEQRLLQSLGATEELRRRELEALDPSNRALQQLIYGLDDLKTAATTAAEEAAQAWQNWGTAAGLGATYLGDTSGLEARRAILGSQISASTDPAERLSKLQEIISIEQAIGQAQQASRKTEIEAINARQSALQKEVASAQQLLSAAKSLGSYVQSLRLGEASGLSEADRLGALGGEYASLVGRARGGDADALQRLQSVASDYLSLSQTLSVSGSDYSVLAGRVSAELEAVSKAQELVAQSQVTGYEAQIAQLAKQTEILSANYELTDGTKSLISKSAIDQAEVWDRENTQALTLQELQKRAVDSLSLMPVGIASAIKPTIEGSASYIANSVGGSVSSAINALAGLLGGGESVPAFAAGGLHAGGLRLVGERGPELEVTGPARYWSSGQTQALLGSGGTERLEALVEQQTQYIAKLESRLAVIEANTRDLYDITDQKSEGGNADRVELMNVEPLAKAIAEKIKETA